MRQQFKSVPGTKPGDKAPRRAIKHQTGLRIAPSLKIGRFLRVIITQTPFLKIISLLIVLWLLFSAGVYFAEQGADGMIISSYGRALYWGIAAFSTAGIADTPLSGTSRIIGGIWIVIGSMLFFGTIVATISTYFMRPLQRPAKQIIDTIEYNLEQMEDLSKDELDLLRETTDALINHVERLKEGATQSPRNTAFNNDQE